MRKMKKIMAVILSLTVALTMGLAMSSVAFAAGSNTITVDKNFKGQTYTLYKIFNATVNDSRKAATDKNNSTSVDTAGISYTLIDETDYALDKEFTVTKADGTSVKVKGSTWFEFVNATNHNIKAVSGADITTEEFRLWAAAYGVVNATTHTANADNDESVKWTGLDDGYYFITTTTGTLVTVDSVAPNAIVKDKNSVPTVDKTVEEDSTGTYQKQNDAEIGQTVNFKTTIAAKKGGSAYTLMDKMSEGLTFSDTNLSNIKVYKGSIADNNLLTKDTHYTVQKGGDYYAGANGTKEEDKATFTLKILQTYVDSLTADTDIIVTYSATVNNKAVMNTAVENKTTLEYGNNTRTSESETKTYVWGIDLLKKDGSDSSKVLKDAEFVIYKKVTETPAEGNPTTSIYYAKFDSNNKLTGWTAADTETVANLVKKEKSYFTGKEATILTTGNDGTFAVTGLDEGSYFLIEVTAPSGYNKLDAEQSVTISSTVGTNGANLTNALTSGTNGSTHIDVVNNQGSVLPSTGGIGTTIFYILGALLVVGAGVLLVARRRMNAND